MLISEIFTSIDGEVNHHYQGCFSTFVRMSGCNLRCKYCDTERAWERSSGIQMSTNEILIKVKELGCSKITITGGEPLLQIGSLQELVDILLWDDFKITIETNGSFPIFNHLISGKLTYVMDYKLPSSGMMDRMMNKAEYVRLSYFDFLKFVIMDRKDYEAAKQVKTAIQKKGGQVRMAFSPVYGVLDAQELIEWCTTDRLFDVIINLQLHKILNLKEG